MASEEVPMPSNAEALMAERQMFWARFCRIAFWAVVAVGSLLVLLDWALL